jgi:hypothetical protein
MTGFSEIQRLARQKVEELVRLAKRICETGRVGVYETGAASGPIPQTDARARRTERTIGRPSCVTGARAALS